MKNHFQTDKFLSDFSTFGIGGPARALIQVTTYEAMVETISYCHRECMPYIVIGKGSNIVFDDRGFDGLAIINRIGFCEFSTDQVYVGAGYSFSLLGVQTARKGFSGLEFASGIPGSVGGAVYMNAGASQAETFDALQEVTYVSETGEVLIFKKNDLEYGYRFSCFQKKKGAIVGARFALKPFPEARKKQLEIVDYRTKTQPYTDKSAGCVFRNPQKRSAGALIEECGLKGVSIGGAEVSSLHANFIVNRSNATAKDVHQLVEHIRRIVKEKKETDLELEVRFIPYQIQF